MSVSISDWQHVSSGRVVGHKEIPSGPHDATGLHSCCQHYHPQCLSVKPAQFYLSKFNSQTWKHAQSSSQMETYAAAETWNHSKSLETQIIKVRFKVNHFYDAC
uniref:Uncharacterized protein n=1 Tax=Sphaerodactylus townsendi TaxID=933632 RepID=A0ACB8F4B8_9SAUR